MSEKLPDHMRREIERAIHDAEHPAGMGPHSGMARISAATLRRLVALAERQSPATLFSPSGSLGEPIV